MRNVFKLFVLFFLSLTLVIVILSSIVYSIPVDKTNLIYQMEVPFVKSKLDSIRLGNYNTLFFGTSKLYRGLNPELYDSLCLGSKTYNAGIPGLYPFRQYDFIRASLQLEKKYTTIFIELDPFDKIKKNYASANFINALSFKRYADVVLFSLHSVLPVKYRLYYLAEYTRLMAYKYSGFLINKRLEFLMGSIDFSENIQSGLEPTKDGHCSLNSLLNIQIHAQDYRRFKSSKWSDDAMLISRFSQRDRVLGKVQKYDYINELLSLYELVKMHTEKVVFIIPPRTGYPYINEMLQQKEILNQAGALVLDFSDPTFYPELYKNCNSFNVYHLNEQGAEILTTLLASSYSIYN